MKFRLISWLILLAAVPQFLAYSATAPVCAPSDFKALAPKRIPVKIQPPAESFKIKPEKDAEDIATWMHRRKVRIGSFNTLNLKTFVGKFKPVPETGKREQVKPSAPKSAKDREGIAKAIMEIDYDAVVLQEVEGGKQSAQEFCDIDLKGLYKPLYIKGRDGRGIDVVVLVKKNCPLEFEYISHKNEQWTDPDHHGPYLFSRDVTALVARAPGHEKPLFVMLGSHFKSKRTDSTGDPESNRMRGAQGDRAADIVDYYEKQFPETPVFFGADFNDEVNHAPSFAGLREKMKDSFDVAQKGKIPLDDIRRVTHTYHGNGPADKRQIDAMLANKHAEDLVIEAGAYRYKNEAGEERQPPDTMGQRKQNPSDHNPVWVDIDWQTAIKRAGIDVTKYPPPPRPEAPAPWLVNGRSNLAAEAARIGDQGSALGPAELAAIQHREKLFKATPKEVAELYAAKVKYLLALAEREERSKHAAAIVGQFDEGLRSWEKPLARDLLPGVIAATGHTDFTFEQVRALLEAKQFDNQVVEMEKRGSLDKQRTTNLDQARRIKDALARNPPDDRRRQLENQQRTVDRERGEIERNLKLKEEIVDKIFARYNAVGAGMFGGDLTKFRDALRKGNPPVAPPVYGVKPDGSAPDQAPPTPASLALYGVDPQLFALHP